MARSVFIVLSFLLALVAVHGAIFDDTKTDPQNRSTLDIIETADRLGGAYGFLTALDETNLTDFVRNLRKILSVIIWDPGKTGSSGHFLSSGAVLRLH